MARLTYEGQKAALRERIADPQMRTEAVNALAKLRGTVLKTLEHEVAEIRLLLDRPNPKVGDALAQLRYLDDLITELDGPIYLTGG
jgi:hypothetical protein